MKPLQDRYEKICNEYLVKFCNKQGFSECDWIKVGFQVIINDWYFDFVDIVLDIDENAPKGLIIDWYEFTFLNAPNRMNYWSYVKGLRYEDLIKQVDIDILNN